MLTYRRYATEEAVNTAAYEAARYDFLLDLEESGDPKELPYADTDGIATIGIGFNLRVKSVRDAVLRKLGFNVDRPNTVEQHYINEVAAIAGRNYKNKTASSPDGVEGNPGMRTIHLSRIPPLAGLHPGYLLTLKTEGISCGLTWVSAFLILWGALQSVQAGEYRMVKGQGVEVCEAYRNNLNSFRPKVPMTCKRKLNPAFKEFSTPMWRSLFRESRLPEGAIWKLRQKIDHYLWERDVNPVLYMYENQQRNWRGTPEQLAEAWRHYQTARESVDAAEVGRLISDIDIDNDGIEETVYYDAPCNSGYGATLVLQDDFSDVDRQKTELIQQHPPFAIEHPKPVTDEGKLIMDALHESALYDVFAYKGKTYFDLWREGHYAMRGILRVFKTEDGQTEEICAYEFVP